MHMFSYLGGDITGCPKLGKLEESQRVNQFNNKVSGSRRNVMIQQGCE